MRRVIALVFSYEVRDAEAFERAYGTDGEWAQFFRHGPRLHRHGAAARRRAARPLPRDRPLGVAPRRTTPSPPSTASEYMRRVDDTRFFYDQELRFGTFENVWRRAS